MKINYVERKYKIKFSAMSKVIGIASEGPTDYLVLKEVIDKITVSENGNQAARDYRKK